MSLPIPDGYRPLTEDTVSDYLADLDCARDVLGGTPQAWNVREVGDGNLNLVFIAEGPTGGTIVKQALPYVRLVGESWPLPLSRAHFEHLALAEHNRLAPGLVPAIKHYDERMALIVMEYLTPHIIMRQGMIKAVEYPHFADHISTFMAQTLFFTSDLALTAADKKERIAAFCGNHALCKITEDLIFTDPYRIAELNNWTSPQLDDMAEAFRQDGDLKVAVSRLKLKFLTETQALLHGDLHTGSLMVTPQETKVIDPEFAFYGPMGFDIGAVLANLLINYFSQDGHATADDPRDTYHDWVLTSMEAVWRQFSNKFLDLWRQNGTGDAYPADLFSGAEGARQLEAERHAYMDRLLQDSIGFCAAKMIRRVLGLAHNIDLEWIEDADTRAACERRVLTLARSLMVDTQNYASIEAVSAMAWKIRDQ